MGSYGKDCGNHCSSHCRNMTCNSISGSCLEGCTSGYLGSFCNKQAPIVSNDEYSTPDAYIAALSISLVINFSLVVVIVILLRLLYNRKQEMRSSDYVTSAEISPPLQVSNNDVHLYQELNIPNDSSYQNLSLRDRS
ncbi:uncharacterized protein LOC130054345 [Ostrea edulis]|uniref:uncharacterized protein LOC130054345 n=1 Tax=Ostrea edulis TaxID=37623 RepID=UPI0024AEA88E|nr:uncharacterized protein LOC130054345 [Ostrea edulis]XP_056019866.1 uncharacterized protein LOC130054345 [Ostrea edulis]